MTNQSGIQATLRSATGKEYPYEGDWHAYWDSLSIAAGPFNGRLLSWINTALGANYSDVSGAKNAFAVSQGFTDWNSMNAFTISSASSFLRNETDGFAIDFRDQSMVVKDTATPANNYSSQGRVLNGALVGPGGKLAYASPSLKLCRQSDGFFKYQPHNLFTFSSDLSNAAWAVANCTKSGTTEATITLSAGSLAKLVNQSPAWLTSAPGAFAVEAKAGTHTFIQLWNASDANAYANFDVANGVVGTVGSSVTASIEATSSGYYRCTIQWATINSASANCRIYAVNGLTSTAGLATTSTGDYKLRKPHLRRNPAISDYVDTGSAAVYVLPYDWDTAGNCCGIRATSARTNLITFSSQFDNAYYTKTRASITADSAVAPDGTMSADFLSEDGTATSSHQISTGNIAVTSGSTYVYFKFVKPSSRSYCALQFNGSFTGNPYAFFDLNANTVTSSTGVVTAGVIDAGNGWKLVYITATASATGNTQGVLFLCSAANTNSYSGDGASGLYIWGAELEAGTFPGSPIPTYGATVTRAADLVTLLTNLFPYSQTAGSLLVIYSQFYPSFIGAGVACFRNSATALQNILSLFSGSSSTARPRFQILDGNVTQVDLSSTQPATYIPGAFYTAALGYAANNTIVAQNGTLSGLDSACTIPSTVNVLDIGSRNSGSILDGYIAAIVYVPRRKVDADIQADSLTSLKTVVCDGNSLTAGQGGTPYPSQLATLLGTTYSVLNYGVGGQTTADMIADAATQIDPIPKGTLVAWEAGNDIVNGADLATTIARWQQYFSDRKTAGWGVGSSRLITMTVTPRTTFTAGQETIRTQFNDWLRANYSTYATNLVDVAADARLQDPNSATYYSGDGVHFSTAGYAVVAALVRAVIP